MPGDSSSSSSKQELKELPLERITLYKNALGFYEHEAKLDQVRDGAVQDLKRA